MLCEEVAGGSETHEMTTLQPHATSSDAIQTLSAGQDVDNMAMRVVSQGEGMTSTPPSAIYCTETIIS